MARIVLSGVLALLVSYCGSAAFAQDEAANFPDRPIRFVVGYAPGGATDIIARAIGEKLQQYWGQPIVLEHRPGAGTNVATEFVAHSPKDGYNLLLMTTANAINPSLYAKLRYDVSDLGLVTNILKVPVIIVANPSLPIKTLPDLIAAAKADPGKFRYASPGFGSTHHLAAEAFMAAAGVNIQRVPYKGANPAMTDVIGGHVEIYFGGLLSTLPHVQGKSLHPLAVTSLSRAAVAPDIPTADEQGLKGFEASAWYGVAVAGGTPQPIIRKINAGIVRALKEPDVAKRFIADGAELVGDSPQDFAVFFQQELDKWKSAVKSSGAKPE